MNHKIEWLRSHTLLDGHSCVLHKIDKSLNFFGHRGQIWKSSENTYRAVIWAGKNRSLLHLLPNNNRPIKLGDEILFQFEQKELSLWLKLLKVPKYSAHQVKIANKKAYLH